MIAAGICDAAVVGGVDSLCLMTLYGFHSLGLTSPGPCRPYDAERDGISIGEGGGFALLERGGDRLSAQVQREANVLAYIDGFWLCFWLAMAALFFVALITRAPPGPFTPAPFGFAKSVLRKCGVAVPQ